MRYFKLILVLMILLTSVTAVVAYTIDGDVVYVDNVKVYHSQDPATTGKGWAEHETEIKVWGGMARFGFLTDGGNSYPTKLQLWNESIEIISHNYTCSEEFNHTSNYFWCFYSNGTMIYEHSFETGDPDEGVAYWTTEEVTGYKKSKIFNFDHAEVKIYDLTDAYYITANLIQGKRYRYRVYWEVPLDAPLRKHGQFVYPDSYGNNYMGAYTAGHYLFLDPWTQGTTGIVAYYSFDDDDRDGTTVIDLADNYNCSNTGIEWSSEAKINTSAYMVSTDLDECDVGSTITEDFDTMSMWVKLTVAASATEGTYVFGESDANNNNFMAIGSWTGGLTDESIALEDATGDAFWWDDTATSGFLDTNWHHIVLVWVVGSSNYRLYIDNSDKGLATKQAGTTQFGNFQLRLGLSLTGNPGTAFGGRLDEFAIFNRSLSVGEIGELYVNFSETRDVMFPPPNEVPYLVSYNFSPATVPANVDLNISVVYADFEGDDINISVNWLVNNVSVLNASSGFVANGSVYSTLLDDSYYAYLDNVSAVLSAVDNNSGASVDNFTSEVTILGYPTYSITDLAVVTVFKSYVVLNWTNPDNYNSTRGFLDGTPVFNEAVSEYNFTGLATNTSYNFSFTTISNTSVENTTEIYVVQATDPNFAPNITDYNPVNLTPSLEENTTQSFNVTATDEDGAVWYKWLLDGVIQSFNQVWNWVIGFTDEGSYNVTVVVNDTYGDEAFVSWAVTVEDTFAVPSGASIYLFGKTFRNNIPVSCFENDIRNIYYDLAFNVNGGAYSDLFVNKTVCDYVLDIDTYDFGTNFSFRARSRNIIGQSNYTYSYNVTKANKELFYIYLGDDPKPFIPYDVGFIANFNNNNSVYIAYAFIDCNGDKVYDYAFDYNSTNSSELYNKVNQRFVCVNSRGSFTHNIYLVFGSTSSPTEWSSVGCNAKANDDFCYINKAYRVVVT